MQNLLSCIHNLNSKIRPQCLQPNTTICKISMHRSITTCKSVSAVILGAKLQNEIFVWWEHTLITCPIFSHLSSIKFLESLAHNDRHPKKNRHYHQQQPKKQHPKNSIPQSRNRATQKDTDINRATRKQRRRATPKDQIMTDKTER